MMVTQQFALWVVWCGTVDSEIGYLRQPLDNSLTFYSIICLLSSTHVVIFLLLLIFYVSNTNNILFLTRLYPLTTLILIISRIARLDHILSFFLSVIFIFKFLTEESYFTSGIFFETFLNRMEQKNTKFFVVELFKGKKLSCCNVFCRLFLK